MADRSERAGAFDTFIATNMLLFVGMCWLVYYDRFVAYRGAANVTEFFVYACTIVIAILAGWRFLRRWAPPPWLLLMMQAGILLHFAGAFVPISGGRLYDAALIGVRFDKAVHTYNALVGAALLSHLFDATGARVPFRTAVICLTVLGIGAVIEMVEFVVTLTVPHNGVGTYDNNMGDMVANLTGTLARAGVDRLRLLPRPQRTADQALAGRQP